MQNSELTAEYLKNCKDDLSLRQIDYKIDEEDYRITLDYVELLICAVHYLRKSEKDRYAAILYATPEEIRYARYPEVMFQLSEDGYKNMMVKVERLELLRSLGYYDRKTEIYQEPINREREARGLK